MKSSEQTGAYFFSPISNNSLILGEGIFFELVLSLYAKQPHKFTSLNFRDVTPLLSIETTFNKNPRSR